MSTGSKPRKFAARAIAGTVLAVTGSAALAIPAQAGGLSGVPSWQDGSVGATFGCSLARTFVNDKACGGMLGFPMK